MQELEKLEKPMQKLTEKNQNIYGDATNEKKLSTCSWVSTMEAIAAPMRLALNPWWRSRLLLGHFFIHCRFLFGRLPFLASVKAVITEGSSLSYKMFVKGKTIGFLRNCIAPFRAEWKKESLQIIFPWYNVQIYWWLMCHLRIRTAYAVAHIYEIIVNVLAMSVVPDTKKCHISHEQLKFE